MAVRSVWRKHLAMKHSWFRRARIPSMTSEAAFVLVAIGACAPIDSSKNANSSTAHHSPVQLSVFDMDRVSAAGVSVDIDSTALVKGQTGHANTDVMTGIVGLGPRLIGYGFGSGDAIACCGDDSEVKLDMSASGIGDYVYADTHTAYGGDGINKFGVAQGVVLALSGPSREELAAATFDYLSQLALAPPSTYQPSTDRMATKTAE